MIKHDSLLFVIVFCAFNTLLAQTTVCFDFTTGYGNGTTFTNQHLDTNIRFTTYQNNGTANTRIFNNQLRCYQNATKGGGFIIEALNGVTITEVEVTASGTTGPAEYSVDAGTAIGLSANTTYTMPGLSASNTVEFYQKDGSSNNRIYVDQFCVTYTTVSDLSVSGTPTNHGMTCLNTAATAIQYTITNNSTVAANNITVTSDNTAFAVSGLSATSIPPSGTATYNLTFTPTTAGLKTATITVSSSTITGTATSIVTGTGITAPVVTTQPAGQTAVIPNTASFSVSTNSASMFQWQVNTGSGWANVTTGSGANTSTYTTPSTTAAMHGYLYRCNISNSCGSTSSSTANLTLSNGAPSNAQALNGCFTDNGVSLSWNHPSTPPEGYVIFAIAGTTAPTAPPNDANTYTANPDFNAAPLETPASLGKVVYKGNGTATTVTGLTESTTYSFRIFAYNGESLTGWANGTSSGSNLENTAQDDVRNLSATPLTNQVTLNWNNPLPSACFDELLIVANQGPVTFTPSGSYAPINTPYSTPNSVVYATTGTPSSKAITGLNNNLNYCFKIFIRRGANWSDGTEVCATPTLAYCSSDGGTNSSGILNVSLNTINNNSASTNAYSDFSSISTNITLDETYNLSVNVNTGGNYTSKVKAWIDWNQDGSFTTNESYELGEVTNSSNTQPNLSPLAILVPTNAVVGSVKMRVSAKSDNGEPYATPCENFSYGEVEDYTIIVNQPAGPEINIKGGSISIPNGFNSPYGLNNTLFPSTTINTDSASKTFSIENIGLTTLTLSGSPTVQITGANASDFIVVSQPSTSIASSGSSPFSIKFHPTGDGVRTALVSIPNSDSNENPYLLTIQGTGVCSSSITSSITPASGPVNTEISITSSANLNGASANINGITMPIITSTATELIVAAPSGAVSGAITLVLSTGCTTNSSFTVLNNVINGCDNGASTTVPTDLFISEISDATNGSSTLIEIYNGTGATINLADYAIKVFNNGSTSPSSTNMLTGSLANNSVYIIVIGTTTCDLPGSGLSITPNQTFSSSSGINFDVNGSDALSLEKVSGTNTGIKDVFGVLYSYNWANSLGIGNDGVNFKRKNNASYLPSTTFTTNDWDIIDWTSCNDSDYSDFGFYDFSLGTPPMVTLQPTAPISNCDLTAILTVQGQEGVANGKALTYQWFYNAPGTTIWSAVSNAPPYSGSNTNTLTITNSLSLDNYQFYCRIKEDDDTCYQASEAIKLHVEGTTWNGSIWDNGPPNLNTIAILDGAYNTTTNGNFSACQLLVNAGYLLTITNQHFVEVKNNLIANGTITVKPQGAFVQINDAATVNGSGTMNVEKITAPSNNWYEYTYWSSPVSGETIGSALANANDGRIYKFVAENYLDATMETNNNNATTPGQDDIDDNGDDWQWVNGSTPMIPGVGYIAMHDKNLFNTSPDPLPRQFLYTFTGPFNNGIVAVDVYRNDSELNDFNGNLLGNPYPSAINANDFLTLNTYNSSSNPNGTITGLIYLWSHNTAPSSTANGNQAKNFSTLDYALINGSGSTAGGDMVTPSNFIPSGQGFFVDMHNDALPLATNGDIASAKTLFNNSLRSKGTSDNDQFFKNASHKKSLNNPNRLWLNLTSDNGVFNQLLVAYVEGATNSDDGPYYDAPHMGLNKEGASLYSLVIEDDQKLTIQGRSTESLKIKEVITLGFKTTISDPTLYTIALNKIEGDFLSENSIYLKDHLLNTVENLKIEAYSFTSEVGEFNNRFEILFEPLSNDPKDDCPSLSIEAIDINQLKFTVFSNSSIATIELFDVLGRSVYVFRGSHKSEVLYTPLLKLQPYVAKVTLRDGSIIVKKILIN